MYSHQPSEPDSNALTAAIAVSLLSEIAGGRDMGSVLQVALRELIQRLPLTGAMLVTQVGREWQVLASGGETTSGSFPVFPHELVADSLDRSEVLTRGNLIAAGLSAAVEQGSALVLNVAETSAVAAVAAEAKALAKTFACGMQVSHQMTQLHRRCDQFEQMLRIGAQWSREEDVNQLLEAIAEAAARLLGAERASIFLWDRPRRKLVGRPALGVEGGMLEVDDSAGIVGAVLQSGEARRWHSGDDRETEVNRSVDRKLKFETRSLLAVPMLSVQDARDPIHSESTARSKPSGKSRSSTTDAASVNRKAEASSKPTLIGVFEVINRIQGQFTKDDEQALSKLATQAAAAIQNTQLRQTLIASRDRLVDTAAQSAQVVGEHPLIIAVRTTAERVAETDLSVLILGENGTGKEVLARSIHFASPRRHQPFVAVNCAALVETLLESELFGHEKGAFTDAQSMRQGKFEVADGGTLFLDEIGDLSAGGQAKLLRVLEERKVVRVGGSATIPVDVRVIAATNQPLLDMVRDKKFREDLFFRLNIVTLNLPPLRQRGNDIIELAEHFLLQFAQQIGRKRPSFSAAAKQALIQHPWPGNIRELRNLVERVCYLCSSEVIGVDDLMLNTAILATDSSGKTRGISRWLGKSLADATKEFQVEQIEQAIGVCQGNITDAAARLGLHRSNLYRKMRQLGIEIRDEYFG